MHFPLRVESEDYDQLMKEFRVIGLDMQETKSGVGYSEGFAVGRWVNGNPLEPTHRYAWRWFNFYTRRDYGWEFVFAANERGQDLKEPYCGELS